MPTLWFDLDEVEDEDEDFNNFTEDKNEDDLYDGRFDNTDETMDVNCPICGAIVEDGVQCDICGYLMQIYTPKNQKGKA